MPRRRRTRKPTPKGAANPYGWEYEKERRRMLAVHRICALQLVCRGAIATTADHVPPLSRHVHVPGSGCCHLQPACHPCQLRQGALLAQGIDPSARPRIPEATRDW